MSDSDMLDTNPYNPPARNGPMPSGTYGVQSTLKRFQEVEARRRQQQVIPIPRIEPDPEILLEDDPIYSNKIAGAGLTDPNYKGDATGLRGSRVVRERVRLLNISSRHRTLWELEEIPKDPVTGDYTRCIEDEYGESTVVRYDADTLNAEYYWGLHNLPIDRPVRVAEPFVEREGTLYVKRQRDLSPSDYTIRLNTPIPHVKAIRLVASEVPNPYRTIGSHNNRIIFHIKNARTDAILPFRRDYRGIPFYLIEIPEGNYDLPLLMQTIEDEANKALSRYSAPVHCASLGTRNDTQTGEGGRCERERGERGRGDRGRGGRRHLRFRCRADPMTGVVRIELEYSGYDGNDGYRCADWIFHWRFWTHWSVPEQHRLYRMLGFARPYLKNIDGTDWYGSSFDNIWRLGKGTKPDYPGGALEEMRSEKDALRPKPRARPFAAINLAPETYIYLIVEGLKLTNDDLLDANPDLSINNIFAKVQVCAGASTPSQTSGTGCRSLETNCVRGAVGSGILYNTAISINKVYLESPLRVLEKLRIRWVDAFGEPVDFGNQDHSLTFEIVQFVDYLTETNFDSTRGVHPI